MKTARILHSLSAMIDEVIV